MFLLPRRQIWTQQPQALTGIDRSDSITRDLCFVQSGGLADIFTNVGTTQKPTTRGVVRSFDAALSQYLFANNKQVVGPALTLFALFSVNNLTSNLALISVGGPASSRHMLYVAPDGILALFSGEGGSYGQAQSAIWALPDTTQYYFAVGRVSANNSRDVWVNGKQVASDSTSIAVNAANIDRVAIGCYWSNGAPIAGFYFDGSIALAGAYSRALSDAEIVALSANPWRIFKRPDSRIFVPVSVGGGSTSLIVQDATHAHNADSPSFSIATYLAVAESLHAHAADNVTLATTGTANLVVQEATHAHVADGVSLTTQWLLAVAEALHSHTAESVTLSLQTALVVLEALHSHTAENLTLGVTGTANLTIADATSGHTSDTVALTLNSLLAVFDAIHAHAADSLTLDTSNATALTVQESTHAHGADNLGLSLDTWLAIVEAAHGHTADAPTLSTALALQIAESLHAHYADVVVLGFPSAPGSCPTVEEIVQAVLLQLNAESISAAVWAHATRVITGPTPNDNADALLARNWP